MVRVPVIIIGGFLGSGKTTLLLHLFEQAKKRNYQPGMLINELGERDTDGNIVRRGGESQLTLLDGCICCTKKSEIVRSFEKLLQTRPDIIFVELTGVASPQEVSKELSKRELISKVYLNKIFAVLDAENILGNFERFSSDHRLVKTLYNQISIANAVLINKTDLANSADVERITEKLQYINHRAKFFLTEYGQINPDFVFDQMIDVQDKLAEHEEYDNGNEQVEDQHQELSYEYISTVSIPVTFPVTEELITSFFAELGSKLIRAKGFVKDGIGQTYLIQFAGSHITWEMFPNFTGAPYITIIGIDFHAEDVFNLFNRLAPPVTD